DSYRKDNGIGDYSFEQEAAAVETLKTLRLFYSIFKDDPMYDKTSGIKGFSIEYIIVSMYLLIRHLRLNYVTDDETKANVRNFFYYFYERWKTYDKSYDIDLLTFGDQRQQGEKDLETRDIILRQIFFEWLEKNKKTLVEKDTKRAFTELERIMIYRKGKGVCQQCAREGKPEAETKVSWSNYQADHVIPHSKGGLTTLDNSELLCRYHNQSKGASLN
ncbi:MAG: HNH endonuclease, partial [Alphaproteobacteria bacterium]